MGFCFCIFVYLADDLTACEEFGRVFFRGLLCYTFEEPVDVEGQGLDQFL